MRFASPNAVRFLLSCWALIPCIPLMVAGYLLAGVVAMAADDFQRDPTASEMAIISAGFVPTIWFAAIVARFGWHAWRRFIDPEHDLARGD